MTAQRSFPLIASILTVIGVMILCGLGTWQLYRLEWKQGIERDLAQAYDAAGSNDMLDVSDAPSFAYGSLEGLFMPEAAFLLGPRVFDKAVGASLMIPLQTRDGIFLINLGWTDQALDRLSLPNDNEAVFLSGLARRPYWNSFTPENIPEKSLWYRPDLQQISTHFDLIHLQPYIFYADHISGIEVAGFPRNERWVPVNNHGQYAAFWFAMAAILILIYWIRFWRESTR